MSYQHLYSRVPARVSLFNKRDGFDTFAHSAGLNRDFILGELSVMYAGKLELHDPAKIRKGEISTIYSQALLPAGVVAQTAVSYSPVDFTGERSAYFAHTLILTEEERAAVLRNPEADCFNPQVFFTDISRFNLTAPGAAPNPAGPQREYISKALANHRETILKYDPEMVKKFISATLCAICSEGREVFFRLPCDDTEASDESLALLNAIMSVLPYGLRERMSFVSFVSHPEHYRGFKVKCLSSDAPEVAEERGAFFDFANKMVTGLPGGYDRNTLLASFFYSLFEYRRIRDEFLPFMARIAEKYETLELSIDNLRDLVFLFWQCSGFYVENTVVPSDESICNLLDVYGRYREGLIVEHRVRAFRPLARYGDTHTAIPDGVFSRLSALYPTDCVEAKAVALDVLLKLIHVDLMRDTLFCFISRYYDSETPGVKAVICANLCRVFYGGFLQQPILAFLDTRFRGEPAETRDLILDKLLLSVRTPEIQRHILVFLDRHYGALSSDQKMRVCTTCLEMLPECDTLAELFVSLINRRIGRDSEDISSFMATRLCELLGYTVSHGDGRLLNIFAQNSGFCEELAFRYILESGAGIEIFVAILAAMPAHKRGDKLMRAHKMIAHLPAHIYLDFLMRFTAVPVVVAPSGLRDLLRLDKLASLSLPSDLIIPFRERIIYPVIAYTFADTFKVEYGQEGLADLLEYAEKNTIITAFPQYRLITDYLALVHKCSLGDGEAAFKLAASFPETDGIRANIGEYIKKFSYDPDNQDAETACLYELVANYLTKGNFSFDRIYARYQRQLEESYEDEGFIAKGFNADRRGAAAAIELIISCAIDICSVSNTLTSLVCGSESGLRRAVSDFIAIYGLGAGQLLKRLTKDSCDEIEEICDELIDERNASINSVGDALDLFLRRK